MVFRLIVSLASSVIALAAVDTRVEVGSRAVSASAYRAAVAGVNSCSTFRDQIQSLPTANDLMRAVARSPLAVKSEFENREFYRERIANDLAPVIGDARRVYISAPVLKHWTSYLAEIGKEALTFRTQPDLGQDRLDLSLSASSVVTGSYVGSTDWGARRRVERRIQNVLTVGVLFPQGVVDDTIYFPLSGPDAAALADGAGKLHVLGEIVGASTRKSGGSPTLTNPLETRTTFDEVRLRPLCAYLTLNGRLLDAWSFERW